MLGGFGPPASVALFGWTASVCILLFVFAYVFVGGWLNLRGVRLPIIAGLIHHTQRHAERMPTAALEFLFSILVLGIWFHEPLFFAAIALLAFGDGAAGLVGANWGRIRLPWNERKTVEGVVAGVAGGILGAWFLLQVGETVHASRFEADPIVPDAWYVTAAFLVFAFVAVVYGTRLVMRLQGVADVSNASTAVVVLTAAGCLAFALLPMAVAAQNGARGPVATLVSAIDGTAVPTPYVIVGAAFMMVVESLLRRHDNLVLPLGFAGLVVTAVWLDPLALLPNA